MSRVRPFAAAVAALAAVALSSCGGGHTHSNVNAQLLVAIRTPWQAIVRHDARGFCNAVTPTFASEFVGGLAAHSGRRSTTACASATARQLGDGVLVLAAKLQLAEEDPHWLQRIAVDGHNATVTFRAHRPRVSSSQGSPAGTYEVAQTVTMENPGQRPTTVELVRGSDGRWRLGTGTGIVMTVVH